MILSSVTTVAGLHVCVDMFAKRFSRKRRTFLRPDRDWRNFTLSSISFAYNPVTSQIARCLTHKHLFAWAGNVV